MEVKCDYCGNVFDYTGGTSHFNRTKHHYCGRVCQGYGNNVVQGNVISGMASKYGSKNDIKKYRIWCMAKKRAKKKGIDFNLSVTDMPEIPLVCPVLGIAIKENAIAGPIDSSPSIDRINPNKGYVSGNVRIISNRANRIKADATLVELEMVLEDARRVAIEAV